MKISKKTREQAALICAIAASGGSGGRVYYNMIADDLDISLYWPFMLAVDAWRNSVNRNGHQWTREVDAEAHALLMSGWSPGDEP